MGFTSFSDLTCIAGCIVFSGATIVDFLVDVHVLKDNVSFIDSKIDKAINK